MTWTPGFAHPLIWTLATLFPSQDSKLPVPSEAALKSAEKEIRELFRPEFSKTDREGKRALAGLLMTQALDTKNNAASRYFLLNESAKLAAEAFEFSGAFLAIEQLGKIYDLGLLTGATFTTALNAQKADLLQSARKGMTETADPDRLAEAYLKLADDALTQGEFDDALAAAEQGRKIAKDASPAIRSKELIQEIPLLKKERAELSQAEATLSKKPEDPEANLAVGRHLCLTQGDWERGLPLLMKSQDREWKDLVGKESSNPEGPEAVFDIGEGWRNLAQKEKNLLYKKRYLGRARTLFERALKEAGGLLKLKIEKQLSAMTPAAPAVGSAIAFNSPADLQRWVNSGGHWRIEGGELVGTCPGDAQWASLSTAYRSIREVTLLARIIPPAKNNLRLWVGNLHLIFNWECADENHYRNGSAATVTKSHALTPGKEHEITLRQEGEKVVLEVDRKKLWETPATLGGAISLQAAWGSTLGVRQLRVAGDPDTSQTVIPPTRPLP